MSDTDADSHGDWRPRSNPWLIAVVVTLAAFMEILDTTIVNVALPHIAGAMSAGQDESTWSLTSYLIANSIVLPISGFLARFFGRKRYFLICVAAFTACSFLCGIAQSMAQLVMFRLLQGFFGGGLQPNQQAIILDTFKPAQRGTAFSVTAVATIVAPVLGPTLGGWITDHYSWRWVFLINVPVGIMTFFAILSLVEDPPWLRRVRQGALDIDYLGLALIALGFGCLQIVLDRGEDDDWLSSPFIRTFAVLAALGLAGAVAWLLTTRKPIVDLRALRDRNFALGCGMIFAMALVLYASAVLIPQLTQQQLGYTATWAGLVLSPGALAICFFIPVLSRVLPYVQTRLIVALGFAVLGGALLYSHQLSPQIDFRTLVLMRAAQSLGIGFLFVPISALTYLTLPQRLNSDGAALFTMFRNLAGSIGISVSTALVTQRTQVHMAYLVDHLSPLSEPYAEALANLRRILGNQGMAPEAIPQAASGILHQQLIAQSTVLGYLDIFAYSALVAFAMVPLAFLFSPAKAAGGAGAGH